MQKGANTYTPASILLTFLHPQPDEYICMYLQHKTVLFDDSK